MGVLSSLSSLVNTLSKYELSKFIWYCKRPGPDPDYIQLLGLKKIKEIAQHDNAVYLKNLLGTNTFQNLTQEPTICAFWPKTSWLYYETIRMALIRLCRLTIRWSQMSHCPWNACTCITELLLTQRAHNVEMALPRVRCVLMLTRRHFEAVYLVSARSAHLPWTCRE